ncbi:MAG: hypothetical protein HBSAPP03_27860 [Phycisphaerae bacterium]|nr:MAG: hypothetical protein HBSAPP03_27860 [Phycisphaerae bacterium]
MKESFWVVVVVSGLLGVGCAGRAYTPSGNALADVADAKLNPRVRIEAIPAAVRQSDGNESLMSATYLALDKIAWDPMEHPSLRSGAIRALFEAGGDTTLRAKDTARRLLPKERSREVVLTICEAASAGGWHEFEGAILRSYVRPVKGVEDKDRAERAALARLRPGMEVPRIAFDVFASGTVTEERLDAWDVVHRFDPTGTARRAWLTGFSREGDEIIAAMDAARRDLRAMPRSSKEVQWLLTIRQDPKSGSWWREATQAAALVPAGETLELRHAESLRWASRNQPAWLSKTRSDLIEELRGRLRGREFFSRTVETQDRRPRDRLEQIEPRLAWGDVLQALVLDSVIRSPGVPDALLRQAELDRKDSTTEYGGVIEAVGTAVKVVLHMPRPSERAGDSTFVASPEMIAASTYSLAHFHFHAQNWRQQEYAGPSPQDLEYAARYGRACVVLTAVREGELGVDYYQPEGVVVDLGTIRSGGN